MPTMQEAQRNITYIVVCSDIYVELAILSSTVYWLGIGIGIGGASLLCDEDGCARGI